MNRHYYDYDGNVNNYDFRNDYSHAYGIPIVLVLSAICILSVWLAKRDRDYAHKTTIKSLNPIYSITKISSPINPRVTRTILYWVTVSTLTLAPAIYFSWIDVYNWWGVDIIWGTVVALVSSWIMNYILGFIHFCFIRKRREHPATKLVEFLALLTVIAFFACTMVAVIDMRKTIDAELWAATFGIAWLLDTFLFDALMVCLGSIKLFRKWFQIRGFYVDSRE